MKSIRFDNGHSTHYIVQRPADCATTKQTISPRESVDLRAPFKIPHDDEDAFPHVTEAYDVSAIADSLHESGHSFSPPRPRWRTSRWSTSLFRRACQEGATHCGSLCAMPTCKQPAFVIEFLSFHYNINCPLFFHNAISRTRTLLHTLYTAALPRGRPDGSCRVRLFGSTMRGVFNDRASTRIYDNLRAWLSTPYKTIKYSTTPSPVTERHNDAMEMVDQGLDGFLSFTRCILWPTRRLLVPIG